MTARLVVVSATGTSVGKTHVSQALLRAVHGLGLTALGLKPIETGLAEATVSDAARLARDSSFHVQPCGYAFAEPLSPHLAARRASRAIRIEDVVQSVAAYRDRTDLLLVELPGGLFTPLTDDTFNADLARDLAPDALLLVAPDRLGVLHDVLSTTRAATTASITIDGLVLVEPPTPDPSTGTNAPELARLLPTPFVATVPRATLEELALHPALRQMALLLTS